MPVPNLLSRVWRRSIVRGSVLTARYARRGARVHPRAFIDAPIESVRLSPGVKVSERCVLAATDGASIEIGENVWLAHGCEFETSSRIRIGSGTSVQRHGVIVGSIDIGRGCLLASNVLLSSGGHVFDRWPSLPIVEQERRAANADRPIHIGDDCWLGFNSVVTPGCTIGRGSVVGANSVVTRDVEPYTVVAGAPAIEIRKRFDWAPPASLDATSEAAIPYLVAGFDLEYGAELSATFVGSAEIALSSGPVSVVVDPPAQVTVSERPVDGWTIVTMTSATRARLLSATVGSA